MTRICLDHDIRSSIVKMSDGNPGAINVMCVAFKDAPAIDPQSILGGYAPILDLDTIGVYGSDIWVLYKDVCDGDMVGMLAVLRANQLGILHAGSIKEAIATGHRSTQSVINVGKIVEQVKERLPMFGRIEANSTPADP